MRKAIILAALLFSATAYALTFGPEQPVSVPSLVPAPWEQLNPSAAAAANGTDFLVTWLDRRGAHSAEDNTPPSLYSAHVWGQTELWPPAGHFIAQAYSAALTPSGFGYRVAYEAPDGIYTAGLDLGGAIKFSPLLALAIQGRTPVLSFASNGGSHLMLLGDTSASSLKLLLLSGDATPKKEIAIGGNRFEGTIVVLDSVYHVIHSVPAAPGASTSIMVDDVLTEASGAVTRHALTGDIGQLDSFTAAGSGDRILTAWISDQTDRALGYVVSDASGQVLTTNGRARVTPIGGANPAVGAGWDGSSFVVGFTESGGRPNAARLLGLRVAPGGTMLNAEPAVFSESAQGAPAFAHNASQQFMTWADASDPQQADLLGRVDPLSATSPAFVVARSAAAQQQAEIASFGDGTITVWREAGDRTAIHASIHTATGAAPLIVGDPIDAPQDHPAVATNGETALVVWTRQLPDAVQVVARRVARDGTALDPAPFELAAEALPAMSAVAGLPTVASDGRDFLAAWGGTDGRLHGAIVGADGHVTPLVPLSPPAQAAGAVYRAHAVWTGNLYLVLWFSTPYVTPTQPLPDTFGVAGSRVTAGGDALDTTAAVQYFNGRGAHGGLTATPTPGGVLVAWSMQGQAAAAASIATVTAAADGTPAQSEPTIVDSPASLPDRLEGAAVGERTLLLWTDAGRTVTALDLGVNGGRSAISPAGADAYDADIAAVGNHFVAVYTRTSDEVGRVFTVASLPDPRRRAAAR